MGLLAEPGTAFTPKSATVPSVMQKVMVQCSPLIDCNTSLYSCEGVSKVHLASFHSKEKSIRPH